LKIEWRDVERVVAEIFSGIGSKVELIPSSKDGGKDVILECKENGTSKTYTIEIKHWRSGQRVGEKKIKNL
jgi:restriction system protein